VDKRQSGASQGEAGVVRILVSLAHPAHVHAYKNLIWALQANGHTVKIAARDKDVTVDLLKNYGFQYELISTRKPGMLPLAMEMLRRHAGLLRLMMRFKPDLTVSGADPSVVHNSRLLGIPSIIFIDNEPITKFPPSILVNPFATVILTLTSVRHDFGAKAVRINGYKELAYLHPNHFAPDSSVLEDLGVGIEERIVVMRFVGWQAGHDLGRRGFDMQARLRFVETLGESARVFITSESPLPEELARYGVRVPPEKIHDLLYYATLLVGDSQTMTTEAAVLGTPAVRCNSFVGPHDMGNFIELERKYELIYSFRDSDQALQKALQLLNQPDVKQQWARKRERLLADKIDVTGFMVDFIENYPESFRKHRMAKSNWQ
jgi:hypothetical protein